LLCVTQIEESSSSTSTMPDGTKTYQEHFEQTKNNIGIKIKNPHLPLYETKNIGSNLNFLSAKLNQQTTSKKAANRSSYNYYPPDVVVKYPLPASLVIQARFLPSCLQRIYRLLISAQVQASVADLLDWSAAGGNNSTSIATNVEEGFEDMDTEDYTRRRRKSPADSERKEWDPEIKRFKGPSVRNRLERPICRDTLKSTIQLEYIHPDKISKGMVAEAFRKRPNPSESKSTIRDPVNYYKNNFSE